MREATQKLIQFLVEGRRPGDSPDPKLVAEASKRQLAGVDRPGVLPALAEPRP
jgi:hypothetical protein